MASQDEAKKSDAKVRRSVTRTILNTVILLLSLAVLIGWGVSGLYSLALGESAVILRLGAFSRVETMEGWRYHLPPPIEYHVKVNTSGLRTESFGNRPSLSTPGVPGDSEDAEIAEQIKRDAIQTADNNIVNVAYELQYKVDDAYSFAFGMARPAEILHDAAEASVREVIGKRTIDAVLSQDRGAIQSEAQTVLAEMLSSYFAAIGRESAYKIDKINLQKPQAPEAVREAFADVVSAGQDEKRATSAATGDSREIMEQARAEAEELRQQAEGYKRSRIIEAVGEASRFEALLAEYQAAPEVTRSRLYLETMEQILPGVEKMVVEPNTVNMLPMLPLGQSPPVATGGAR